MSGIQVTIGLGSNLDEPVKQIQTALASIAVLEGCELVAQSPLYKSAAMLIEGTLEGVPEGVLQDKSQNQPDYINAVALLETSLGVRALLTQLHAIENQQGRVRKERWGARTLDLDILTFGEQQITEPDLQIPHVGIAERNFVLVPLQAMMGDAFVIPGVGELIDLLKQCPADGLEKLEQDSE